MSLSAFVIFFLAVSAVAIPHPLNRLCKTCSTSNAQFVPPANQTNLTAPSGDPSFVLLGVGFQNYTCGNTSTYTSAGATAALFDLSCLSKMDSALFNNIQDVAFTLWSKSNDLNPITQKTPMKLGEHYFIANGNGTISPVWDFRGDSAPNQADAFVLAAKIGDLRAPNSTSDVDWLQLRRVSGDLADTVYRTNTRGGQPPASCTPGSGVLQVKYVAKYYLYGGNITLS